MKMPENASIFSVFVNVFVRQNGSSDMEKKSGHCLKLASVYCFVTQISVPIRIINSKFLACQKKVRLSSKSSTEQK